jgi:purine nucleosidase
VARGLILDTDIGTDADDALALALAIRHPEIDLRGVTTVSGDARRRARIARRLLLLAGREDVEVAAGIGFAGGELGHEGEGVLDDAEEVAISDREGVELLLEADEVVTIGPQTNLAAAVERGATIDRLTVMGGVFAPVVDLGSTQPPSADHNLVCDGEASVRALNAGLSTLYVPLDVTAATYLTPGDVAQLHRGDELCRAVARMIDVWTVVLRRLTGGAYPPDRAVALHDPLAVACTVERSFVTIERLPVTVSRHGSHVRTFVDPVEGKPADVVRSVDVDALREFLLGYLLR